MNPSMSSHYPSSFLSPTPDPATSAALQTPSPFIAGTQTPNSLSLSRGIHWLGAQGPSFVQGSPSPTNTMPSISVRREAEAQAPHFQHPPLPCSTDLKEKLPRPPRPSNAFILFRSDLLKRKFIFKGQEARQHKLSIIAAKCWDKLTPEEKKKWYSEAEREKKAHAIKYADYRSQSQSLSRGARARSRLRDESRITASSPSPRDLEHERLGRLADMAYKEIINDVPSQLKRESTTSPSPCTTAALASGTPTPPPPIQWNDIFTLDCYREQGQPSQAPPAFSSPAGEEGHLSLTTGSVGDFSTFQDARVFPTTGTPYPATIARPATRPMRPTASSFSGTTARQITSFPSELMLQGSTSINEQDLY